MGIVTPVSAVAGASPGAGLVPPGQYLVDDFSRSHRGPTPETDLEDWDFTVVDDTGAVAARWTWPEFRALPAEDITVDIHCVTKWSKLGTHCRGAPVDSVLDGIETSAEFICRLAEVSSVDHCHGHPGAWVVAARWLTFRGLRCAPGPAGSCDHL